MVDIAAAHFCGRGFDAHIRKILLTSRQLCSESSSRKAWTYRIPRLPHCWGNWRVSAGSPPAVRVVSIVWSLSWSSCVECSGGGIAGWQSSGGKSLRNSMSVRFPFSWCINGRAFWLGFSYCRETPSKKKRTWVCIHVVQELTLGVMLVRCSWTQLFK